MTGLRVRRVESFFRQDPADFRVDLLCMAEYQLQERRRGPAGPARRTRQARELLDEAQSRPGNENQP